MGLKFICPNCVVNATAKVLKERNYIEVMTFSVDSYIKSLKEKTSHLKINFQMSFAT